MVVFPMSGRRPRCSLTSSLSAITRTIYGCVYNEGVLYDRLYTGLSEGLVEIERVQGGGQAKGKLTHEVSVQISYGAFSVDLPTLVIGNASARIVFLSLGIDEDKERRAS